MQNGIFFSIISLFYCILLIIVLFAKKRIHSDEMDIYKKLLIVNLFGLIIEIFLGTYASKILINTNYNLAIFFLKFILVYFTIWVTIFSFYLIKSENLPKLFPITLIAFILFLLSTSILILYQK